MLKNRIFFIFFVGMMPLLVFSQTKESDSIKELLSNYEKKNLHRPVSIKDSVQVNLYNKLASAYDFQDIEEATGYAQKALEISKEINYQKGKADAYFHLARFGGRSGRFDASISNVKKALEIYLVLKIDLKVADCYNNLGVFYAQKGNFPESTHYFLQSLRVYEKLENKAHLFTIYANMGTLYETQKDIDKALEFYLKALKVFENENENKIEYSGIYINIGSIYVSKNNLDKAIEMYNKGHRIALINKNAFMEALGLRCLGEVNLKQKQYDKALDLFLSSRKIYTKIGNDDGISTCNVDIGYCYFKKGDIKEALATIGLAMEIFKRDEYLVNQKIAYKYLSEIYNATKNYKLAYESEVLHKKLSDSIFNQEKDKKITQMQMQYEFDKIQDKAKQVQDEKILMIKEETNRERSIKLIAILALICLTILTLIIFSNLKKNKKQKIIITAQKETLENQNQVILESLTEKETLLREIHHRVKNNLQIISSLLNIQSQNIVDENVLLSIQEGQSRVQAMSLIHQNLYQSEHLSNVGIENYLRELVIYLSEMFADTKSIQVEVEADNIQFDIDTAIPLGLIVNELVSNAYKYAFDNRKSGIITIQVRKLNGFDYELKVNDNGIGLPENFDPKKSKSLGLKLVSILSRQLRGKMTSSSDLGTSFKVQFKDMKAFQASI